MGGRPFPNESLPPVLLYKISIKILPHFLIDFYSFIVL